MSEPEKQDGNRTEDRYAHLRATQWKPGQSGNPKGRPKRESFESIVQRLLDLNHPDPDADCSRREYIARQFIDMMDPANNWISGPPGYRSWQDTIRVPPRLGAKGTSKTITRIHVTFDEHPDRGSIVAHGEKPTFDAAGNWVSGGWLAHCWSTASTRRATFTSLWRQSRARCWPATTGV